jgi:hypothetical protein
VVSACVRGALAASLQFFVFFPARRRRANYRLPLCSLVDSRSLHVRALAFAKARTATKTTRHDTRPCPIWQPKDPMRSSSGSVRVGRACAGGGGGSSHTRALTRALAPQPSHHQNHLGPTDRARRPVPPARADIALSPTTSTTANTPITDPATLLDPPPPPTCAWPLPPAARVRAFLAGGSAGPYADLVSPGREYEFSARQEAAFTGLERAMTRCARAYGALALTAAAHGLFLVFGHAAHAHHAPPPGALAVAAAEAGQAAAVGCVLWVGSAAFGQVATSRGRDIAWCLSGVRDLGAALGEVAIAGTGLALLHVGAAAAAWPGGSLPLVAALTAAATAGRVLTHGRPDRVGRALRAPSRAVRVLTAPLRAVSRREARKRRRADAAGAAASRVAAFKSAQAALPPRPPVGLASIDHDAAPSNPLPLPPPTAGRADAAAEEEEGEYEFDAAQEQVLSGAIAALHLACLARLLAAAAECVLCAACAATGRPGEAAVAAVGALETAASAALFFFATDSFRAVITTRGSDLAHLLAGLGGLARMFSRLQHVVEFSILLRIVPEAVGIGWGVLSAAVAGAGGWGGFRRACVAAVTGG